jgi:hypothetical protein
MISYNTYLPSSSLDGTFKILFTNFDPEIIELNFDKSIEKIEKISLLNSTHTITQSEKTK